jgi:hypothetical protein
VLDSRETTMRESSETGWIKTKPDEGFFMYFRFYGPLEPFYDKSWKLNDVELVE